MTLRLTGMVCVALAAVCMTAGGALAQTSATDLSGLSQQDLLNLLGALSSSSGSSGTSGTGSTGSATSQPSGRPTAFIAYGVLEHQQFYANAFGKSPAERRAASSQAAPIDTRIPIALIIPTLAKWLGAHIPALSFLADLFGNVTPNPGTGPTPPASLSGLGAVAFVTADDTSLKVGATTTGRLWVQQSSPNTTNDNGIFAVAVNIAAAQSGVVQCQVPVTILSTWSSPTPAAQTGTANVTGGIDTVTAGVNITKGDKSEGISGPVQVFNFTIKAAAAGTVTLKPTNVMTGGHQGVLDYKSQTGDEANYVSVDITVTQ
jgi:hypothetical protein